MATAAASLPGKPALATTNTGLLTVGVMAAMVMQILDTTIANVALPHMQTSLGATMDTVTWVLTSYIVASAIALPITGPMIGPTITPMPQIAMALPWRSGGLMSSITVCESGAMKAAKMPWKTRKATISSRLVEMPHSIEAMTNPPTATRNRLREP